MKITKYEHACFVIEEAGRKLIIDPGVFSGSLGIETGVSAIVVTHYHSDHIDEAKVRQLLDASPDAVIFSTNQTKENYPNLPIKACPPNEGVKAGPFRLEFCGGQHAIIHPSRGQDENIGVMVNDTFYYPGDSFTLPPKAVKVLAAPAAAPWMKISEGMDYIAKSTAEIIIPTHDAVLSEQGKQVHDSMLKMIAEQNGYEYRRLGVGESLEV